MARLEMDTDSTARPDQITAALLDFSERRPDVWPGLKREEYKVFEVGDTWAEIREGTSKSIWARERYDWSIPGTVTWTVQESSFATPGDFVSATITPRGAGSHIHLSWQRRGSNLSGKIAVALIVLTRGWLVKRSFDAGLRKIEAGGAT